MNREMAFKWADELESGNHIQGKSALEYKSSRDGDIKRCCLGVAARMICQDEDRTKENSDFRSAGDNDCAAYHVEFDGDSSFLSHRLTEELGMRSREGLIRSVKDREGITVSLASLNDHGFTFSQIADMIRHFYEEL